MAWNKDNISIPVVAGSTPSNVDVLKEGDSWPGDKVACAETSDSVTRWKPASDLDEDYEYKVYVDSNLVGRIRGRTSTDVLFTDSANSKVGIGTMSPQEKLHVYGTGLNSYAEIESGDGNPARLILTNTEGSGYIDNNANLLRFNQSGSVDMVINSSGRIGIATTAPGKALEINSATGANLRLTYNDSDGSAANYVDLSVSSSGDLGITPSGGDVDFNGSYALSLQNIPDLAANGPGLWFDGSDDKVTVADNAVMDDIFDDGGTISAWIYPKSDGENNNGMVINKGNWILITVTDDGTNCALQLYYIWSGDDGYWTSPVEIPLSVWTHVAVTYDNGLTTNNPIMYIDGKSVTLTEDGTPTGTRTTDDGENFLFGDRTAGARAYDGSICQVYLDNVIYTAAEVKALSSNAPIPYKYLGASQTAKYTSDFSAGVDDWIATNGTAAGNIDGIGGQDNNLRFTETDGTVTSHYLIKYNSCTIGKRYRIAFSYYVPSGQSNIDGIKYYYQGTYSANQATTDAWTEVSIDGVATTVNFQVNATDGGSLSFADAGTDDVFYIRGITITQIGCVAQYEPDGITNGIWYDKSGNELHGTISGALPTNLQKELALENTIAEDTDGGRESALWFLGRQSGGERSTLAKIMASHNGAADDEKGQLQFYTNDTNDGNAPTLRMTIDETGKVGIGTAAPDYELDVVGNIGLNEHLYHNDDADTYIQFTDDQIDFYAGAVRMITLDETTQNIIVINEGGADIDFRVEASGAANALFVQGSDGKVGIGTDAPDYELDVAGNIGIDEYLYHNDDVTTVLKFNDDEITFMAGGAWLLTLTEDTQDVVRVGNTGQDTDFQVRTATEDDALFVQGSNGHVGIGTNAPGYSLDVVGVIQTKHTAGATFVSKCTADTPNNALLWYTNTTQQGGTISVDTTYGGKIDLRDEAGSAVGIRLSGAYTAQDSFIGTVRFEAGGNVGIGVSSPGTLLEIDGATDLGKHLLELDQDDDNEPFIKFDGTTAADQTKSISTVNGDGAVEGPKNFSASAGWAFEGMIRIDVNGTDFWIPYFSADTS